MAKLVLDDISNLYGNTTAAETALNSNFARIEAAVENTLSRDGTIPNQMDIALDMNSRQIYNLADGTEATHAVNLRQLQAQTTPTLSLDQLTDVTVTAPITGDKLTFNGEEWVNQSGAEGGISVLDDLLDVVIAAPQFQHALVYDGQDWRNSALPSGVTDHGALSGLDDDDHPQYLTPTRGTAYFADRNLTVTGTNSISGGGSLTTNRTFSLVGDALSPGTLRYYGTNSAGTKGYFALPANVVDHGALTGLGDDDHPQYLNTTRGNALYATSAHTHSIYPLKAGAESITGAWAFSATAVPTVSGAGPIVYHGSSSMVGGKITVSTSPPSGGVDGDIWMVVV